MSFTIKESYTCTLKVSNSKFIGLIFPFSNNFEDLKKEVRSLYPGAKHYCYAYVCDGIIKFSDDKEPEGTAGKPILNSLMKFNLNRVCMFIVRYFGGTKLGKANLAKAYRECANATLNKIKRYEIINAHVYKIEVGYKEYDQLKKLEKKHDFSLFDVSYDEKIKLNVLSKNKLDKNFFILFKDIKLISEDKKEILILKD